LIKIVKTDTGAMDYISRMSGLTENVLVLTALRSTSNASSNVCKRECSDGVKYSSSSEKNLVKGNINYMTVYRMAFRSVTKRLQWGIKNSVDLKQTFVTPPACRI